MIAKGLLLIGAGIIAGVFSFVMNWLALIPWRKAKDKHWTERARFFHPVRTAAAANLLAIPAALAFTGVLFWPEKSPPWACVAIIASLGAMVGSIPMEREVFTRIEFQAAFRQAAVGCMIRFLIWFVFIGAMSAMPDELNLEALLIGGAVILLRVIWARQGMVWLGKKFGLFVPAPERLQRIVSETADKMKTSVGEVLLMRVSVAQAFAHIGSRKLLFTERLLDLCSDDELAAICAHEIGHLTESKSARFQRSIGLLVFMPWLFFVPLIRTCGDPAFFALTLATVAVPFLSRKVSRNLESRADRIAKSSEVEPGIYAQALTKLYEDGLIPAVMAGRRQTHPDLYDRLLAAGVTPDFSRPKGANTMAWTGRIMCFAVGALFALFAVQMIHEGYHRDSTTKFGICPFMPSKEKPMVFGKGFLE